METHHSLLQYVSSSTEEEKTTYRGEILAASTSYLNGKREHKRLEKEFMSSSINLSRLEKKEFNHQFSPHKFLNAILSSKDEYYSAQEKNWAMILKRITAAPLPEQVANNQPYQSANSNRQPSARINKQHSAIINHPSASDHQSSIT